MEGFIIEINNVYNMDCLIGMQKMIEKGIKVDAIIADIPQEITKNDWDRAIPFEKMWELLYALRKDSRTPIVLLSNQPFSTMLISSNLKHFKYMKYWQKDRPSNFLNARKQPLRDIEEIAIFYEEDFFEMVEISVFYEKQCTYNPQYFEGKPLNSMGHSYKNKQHTNNNYGIFKSEKNPSASRTGDTKKFPRQLLKYPRPHPPLHPTEKPVDLMKDLILTYTDEGDLILDFTAGTYSTIIGCIETSRNYIGFEKEEKYYNIGEERKREAMAKQPREGDIF